MRDPGVRRRRLSLTSLIDVIFLLLLFFMLSSTFSRFSDVELASAGGGPPGDGPAPIFVQLRADALRVNARDVPLAGLGEALAPLVESDARALVSTGADVTAQRLTDLLVRLRGVERLSVRVLTP